jgi:hypothetical protein
MARPRRGCRSSSWSLTPAGVTGAPLRRSARRWSWPIRAGSPPCCAIRWAGPAPPAGCGGSPACTGRWSGGRPGCGARPTTPATRARRWRSCGRRCCGSPTGRPPRRPRRCARPRSCRFTPSPARPPSPRGTGARRERPSSRSSPTSRRCTRPGATRTRTCCGATWACRSRDSSSCWPAAPRGPAAWPGGPPRSCAAIRTSPWWRSAGATSGSGAGSTSWRRGPAAS